MKITKLIPQFVKYIPEQLELGILYISEEYGCSIHLCACGECNQKTCLDFKPQWKDGWTLTNNNGLITFDPSIGNFQFPCKSHYYIRNNEIVWC